LRQIAQFGIGPEDWLILTAYSDTGIPEILFHCLHRESIVKTQFETFAPLGTAWE
jgi:hypothetical protein